MTGLSLALTAFALMLLGIAIIVGSGIYTVWRERKLQTAT